jgi:hypothetical protein
VESPSDISLMLSPGMRGFDDVVCLKRITRILLLGV